MKEQIESVVSQKPAVSLKVMRERGMPGVATVKGWAIDPALVKVRPGFNRPISRDHVESLKSSLRAGMAEFDDIKVEVEDGVIYLIDGEHRWTAVMEWLAEPGTQAPPDGYKMGAKQLRLTEAERIIHLLTSSQGLGVDPIFRSQSYRDLAKSKWTPAQIAKAVGVSISSVRDALLLSGANNDVKEAVAEKQISASNAVKIVRENGVQAGAVIADHVQTARLQGKKKATAKQIAGNTPKDLITAIRREIDSGGTFRAEEICPTFADLITYLRGTAKAAK